MKRAECSVPSTIFWHEHDDDDEGNSCSSAVQIHTPLLEYPGIKDLSVCLKMKHTIFNFDKIVQGHP